MSASISLQQQSALPVKRDNPLYCRSLSDAFAQVDMPFPKQMPIAGKFIRFSTNDKSSDTSGWCKLFPDGVGAVFGCNRDGSSYTWQQRDENAPPPTKKEREAAQAKAEHLRREAEIQRAMEHGEAAKTATRIFTETEEIDPAHAYITRKEITPYCAHQDSNGSIVLPVYGPDGALQSLQFIAADGGKRFLSKSKVSGGRLFLGTPEDGSPLILCEGWATGCTIHEATGETTVIGFTGHNLAAVALDLKNHYPRSPLTIAGDLDANGVGLKYAHAAVHTGNPAVLVMPVFNNNRDSGDFNDLRQTEGLDVVRQSLSNLNYERKSETAIQLADKCEFVSVPFIAPKLQQCDVRDGTGNTRPLTEFGNAQRLLDTSSGRLKYVYNAKKWLSWNGSAWKWDPSGSLVRSFAANLHSQIYAEGSMHLQESQHFAKWGRQSQSKKIVDASVWLLQDFEKIRLPLECIDADHFKVGFDNATQVVDLETGTVRSASRDDYIIKSLNVKTMGNAKQATRWSLFLEQVFEGDLELIDWIQRFCGYMLSGSTKEQFFLFCYGYGANGKSVFIETLKHIMGDYSRAVAPETLSTSKRQAGAATPDLAALIGARLVLCSETEDNTGLAESLVKSLVAGDSMSVRANYGSPVEFTPLFKLIMAGNHRPRITGTDAGMWRRMRQVPFNRTFAPEERDKDLHAKLKAEAPHILAWMVHGCSEWQRRGLTDIPEAIREANEEYREDQDLLGQWLSECTDKMAGQTPVPVLHANYVAWASDNRLQPVSGPVFSRRMKERGYKTRKSSSKTYWQEVVITDARHSESENTTSFAHSNRREGPIH